MLILNLVITFTIPGISIGGHLGGAIAGAICGFVILAPRHAALPKWASYATPIAVVLVAVVGSVAIGAALGRISVFGRRLNRNGGMSSWSIRSLDHFAGGAIVSAHSLTSDLVVVDPPAAEVAPCLIEIRFNGTSRARSSSHSRSNSRA